MAKRTPRGLLIHVAIHLAVTLAMLGAASLRAWPYLVALAACHYGIDTLKNFLYRTRPRWVIGPYWFDQLLHLLSLLLISIWIQQALPEPQPLLSPLWVAYSSGFLVATYVWLISERVMAHAAPVYEQEIAAFAWQRMATRGLLLTLFLWITAAPGQGGALAALCALRLPYLSGIYRSRALASDLMITLSTALVLRWAVGP